MKNIPVSTIEFCPTFGNPLNRDLPSKRHAVAYRKVLAVFPVLVRKRDCARHHLPWKPANTELLKHCCK